MGTTSLSQQSPSVTTKRRCCEVDGCEKPLRSKQFCGAHYWHFLKNGDPLARKKRKAGEFLEWIDETLLSSEEGCILWPFAVDAKTGYPQPIKFRGETIRPHVLMCTLANGPIPGEKFHAAHSCGKGKSGCTNPRHLRWATAKENCADKEIHGTAIKGSELYNAILTEEDIPKIRALKGIMTQQAIADMFGVSRGPIKAIFHGKAWKHVP